MKVVVIGTMASGKTTLARGLAESLGWPLLDSDEQLVATLRRTAREIEAAEGGPALRAHEVDLLAAAMATDGSAVIAAAAGTTLDPTGQALIERADCVVWTDRPWAVVREKVDEGDRPSQGGTEAEFEERRAACALLCHRRIDLTEDVDAEALAAEITSTDRHRRCGRAVILADDHLLVGRYRLDDGTEQWESPGGGRNRGESALDAAVREVIEETGLVLDAAAAIWLDVCEEDFTMDGRRFHSRNTTFGWRLPATVEVFEHALTPIEQQYSLGPAWVPVEQLDGRVADGVVLWPATLRACVAALGAQTGGAQGA